MLKYRINFLHAAQKACSRGTAHNGSGSAALPCYCRIVKFLGKSDELKMSVLKFSAARTFARISARQLNCPGSDLPKKVALCNICRPDGMSQRTEAAHAIARR